MSSIYSTSRWKATRELALERDAHRCTVGRLLGGACSPPDVSLEAHHIVPVDEGGEPFDVDNVGTSCKIHHPMWEALRRVLVNRLLRIDERPPRCPHFHRSEDARRICEARLARSHARARARERELVAA